MPHDYDPKKQSFTTARGRAVPIEEVRAEVDKIVQLVSEKAANLGKRYAAGDISLVEFHIKMRELLKSGHVAAASIGKGGWRRMEMADWGRVGARLKKEYEYLSRFIRKLATQKIPQEISAYRAKKYAFGVVMSYHDTMRRERTESGSPLMVRLVQNSKEGCPECAADADRGWVDPNDMAELGTRICGNFCLCDIEFSTDE